MTCKHAALRFRFLSPPLLGVAAFGPRRTRFFYVFTLSPHGGGLWFQPLLQTSGRCYSRPGILHSSRSQHRTFVEATAGLDHAAPAYLSHRCSVMLALHCVPHPAAISINSPPDPLCSTLGIRPALLLSCRRALVAGLIQRLISGRRVRSPCAPLCLLTRPFRFHIRLREERRGPQVPAEV